MDKLRGNKKTWFVTRHEGAVRWAQEKGIHVDRIVAHLDDAVLEEIQPGDVVIGTLPLHLAAKVCEKGAKYLHLSLDLPPQARGRELTPEEMDRFGARLEAFEVRCCE
ncbi:MAG: CRISPR-associated protein Csx16 [Zetaproteobacteria bacterium]|nr:MAG: CRISPR-associated protein Csx16 [Zetaproteobacteria bacterium]